MKSNNIKQKKDRIGKETISNKGDLSKIIQYDNSKNIVVEFQDEYKYKIKTTYHKFKIGELNNPYNKKYYGIGMVGETNTFVEGKSKKSFVVWSSMFQRCYGNNKDIKKLSYKDCEVCDEWKIYKNFEKWYDEHYYYCKDNLELDKDILIKDNKIYSPNTCLIIPQRINNLFINATSKGKGIGFTIRKDLKTKPFSAKCNNNGKLIYLGYYKTKEEAECAYKRYKFKLIKTRIEEYKEYLPKYLYEILIEKNESRYGRN